jgi:hypothetical protein
MKKRDFVKSLEAEFVKKFRLVLAPMKASIKREIKAGRTAHQAVDRVFREHDIRGHLKKQVVDLMIKAAHEPVRA